MKKRTVVALIVAAILIFTGGVLLVLGLSYAGGPKDMVSRSEITYGVSEPFDSIRVETTVCDVDFQKTDGEFRAVCPEFENLDYTVIVEDNTLYLRQVDLRQWYDFIDIHLGKMEITVYLPENQYNLLRIDTDTGDIRVAEDFSFSTAEIFTDTGDVRFSASVSERFNASASTGDLTICAGTPEMLQVSTSTGDVELENMACGDCFVKTTTGDLFISSLTCQTLDCQSNTGDKFLQNVVAEDYIKAISTTGDVELLGCDAPMFAIETDTGDITGVLLSPKEFFAQTDTGTEHIADHSGTPNGTCYVNSNTGDITISYQP